MRVFGPIGQEIDQEIQDVIDFLTPNTMPTPLDDLNTQITVLADRSNQLTTDVSDLTTDVDNLVARAAAIPVGPDLGPATSAIAAQNTNLFDLSEAIKVQNARINAVLPAP